MKIGEKVIISLSAVLGIVAVASVPASAHKRTQGAFHQRSHVLNLNRKASNSIIPNDDNDFLFHGTQNYWTSQGYTGGSNNLQNNSETLSSAWFDNWKSSMPVHFTSKAYLPTSYNYTNNYLSPQGVAVSPKGDTAWEIGHFNNPDGSPSDQGQIVKFNLENLESQFHTDQNGSMQLIRQAAQWAKTGRKVPSNVPKTLAAYQKAQKKVKAYKKVKYRKWHKHKYCRKHHIKYHSKKWIKNHNRWVKNHNKWLGTKRIKKRVKKYEKTASSKRNSYNNAQNSWNNQLGIYNGVLANIQQGQSFKTGHGQSLAYNPADDQLWYMNYEASEGNPQYLAPIDQGTLKPIVGKETVIDDKTNLGHSFAFDENGHAWFWVYTDGAKYNPKSMESNKQVGIFEADNLQPGKIKFQERADLKNGPGSYQQTCGYNSHTHRFYLVSDSSFISVPVNSTDSASSPLNISKTDVNAFHLDPFNSSSGANTTDNTGGRESEGFTFDNNGTGYFLSNRGPELFTTSDLNWDAPQN